MSRKNTEELGARIQQALEDELAVEELVASIDDIPDEMLTPYNRACRQGDYDTYHRLPAPDERDAKQGPAFYFAIQGGEHRIIDNFICDDLDERLVHDQTPLMVAAAFGRHEAVGAFLINDAQPDLVDRNGESAVHKAARAGDVATLDALLHYGASPHLVDPKGRARSPISIAVDAGHSRCVVRFLLEDISLMNDPAVDQQKLQALRATDGELWSILTFAEGSGPIMSDHFHVEDLHTIQSPRCPFCGKWAWDRQTYEENQESGPDWQTCEHELASGLFMYAFHEPGPLSAGSSFEKDLFADGGEAANELRAAVQRLVQFAEAEDEEPDTLIQNAFGTRPVWWDDDEGKLNESMEWVEYALDDDIAVCSFLHEDIRFVSLATVYCYYAEDHEAVRRRFSERISSDAERLEKWLDGGAAAAAGPPVDVVG